jgi:hypothetical protein
MATDLSSLKHNPAAFFKAPIEVVSSKNLSTDEKIEILQRWAYDEREKEVAEEENMPNHAGNTESRLSDILKALLKLKTESDQGPPTKQA